MLLFEKDKNICKKRLTKPSLSDKIHHVPSGTYALVAQLDRGTDYEPEGGGLAPPPPHKKCREIERFHGFLFFWQSLHTFAHLLHTLQKSHELFASLAQRVFRCTKKNLLREEHPRQLAAFLCVHLPDGFKNHFTRDFCCHRRFVFRGFLRLSHLPHPACRSRLRSSRSTPTGACPACERRCPSGRWRLHGRCCPAPT